MIDTTLTVLIAVSDTGGYARQVPLAATMLAILTR